MYGYLLQRKNVCYFLHQLKLFALLGNSKIPFKYVVSMRQFYHEFFFKGFSFVAFLDFETLHLF